MLKPTTERCLCWSLLAATFAVRAIHPDQPIVENYVGRQVPTAMVARNLERGSGFLRPQLDTGPFPNLFLVEPPIYAQVVAWVHRGIGFDWEICGRLTSALATTLGAWGLFGLARRREGPTVALLALGSFCLFPVMVRYGRAFQPDALMLGFVLAGLRGWDEFEASGRPAWTIFGGFVLAIGLALKITSAWALIPFWLIARRLPIAARSGWALAMLAPALAWYGHAWGLMQANPGDSRASGDNAGLWLASFGPAGWLRSATLDPIARNLLWRAFTPVGFVLASWGLIATGPLDRAWKGWGAGCGLALLALAPKWHHGYYWLAFAPLAAVGVGRGLTGLASRGRTGRSPLDSSGRGNGDWLRRGTSGARPHLPAHDARSATALGVASAVVIGFVFAGLAGIQSASTFRTPAEWRVLDVPKERAKLENLGVLSAFVAPEALLYYLDTRGFRLEHEPAAIRRAAGEWGGRIADPERPTALVDYYHGQGAIDPIRFASKPRPSPVGGCAVAWNSPILRVADVGFVREDRRRLAWREAIRNRPGTRIEVDRDDLFIATLISRAPITPPPPSPGPTEGETP